MNGPAGHHDRDVRAAGQGDRSALLAFIGSMDDHFSPPLSDRVDLKQWVGKVMDLGVVLVAGDQQLITGAIAFYCNDREHGQAFITFLGVAPSARRQGLGRGLLIDALGICRREGMKSVVVTTWAGNRAAMALYEAFGFREDAGESERTGRTALRLDL